MKNTQTIAQELLNEFGEEYIKGVVRYLRCMMEVFLKKRHMSDKVFVDEYLLMQCIFDALVDISRLKHFHDIEYVNSVKLNSYLASWCLRRKPIQRMPSCTKNLLFVNEMFVADFLLSSLDHDLSDFRVYDQAKASEIAGHLMYHLKYRNTNPQTLELFLTGINSATH